ncbi:type II toxin-antitoxin system RelE/ParE family toxin [Thiosulfativibrio zosterae]|uniref:Addiction module killer protein n=1 Tax=Thiosulfativibrio zosterae TaxID=2675053 RepID=A0A6F8PN34_9GAMM|nr:type II toxin-antitoxin system RelE/ParE family toxin [Thiosulfativibrio zosterae]BBP43447.1 hypothetical protein THMIRHAT_11930 [Thiosulfativibrio zosterae]
MIIKKFRLDGGYPFDESLAQIKDPLAKSRVLARLRRLELDNRGDFKNIEGSLYELRIDVGQGWRVYYQQKGDELVLLFLTGNKSTQSKDIEKVKGWIHEQSN